MPGRRECGKKFALRLPQMEYTRFPWAANEPPRADALWGLIEACAPTGVSHSPFTSIDYHQRVALLFRFITVNIINVLAFLLYYQYDIKYLFVRINLPFIQASGDNVLDFVICL